MDTDETIEPVGGQDVSSSQDTSNDIAQPTQSEEVVDGDQSEEVGEAPTLLAGKYTSPQELEKAYNELQGKLGEQGQKAELVNLLEKQTGMNAQQIKEYLAQQQYQQSIEQYQENPVPFLAQEVMNLRQERQLEKQEIEMNNFLSSEEGQPYQDFRDEILEDKQYNPRFQNQSLADIARERYGKAIAKGQQSAYKKIDTKLMTQTTGAMSTPEKKFTAEDMKNMSSKEMESFLSHA